MEPLSDPVIRRLGIDDLEAAFALSVGAGWNQTADDWRMLFRLAPDGCFAAEADERIVGSAIGIDYGSYGWIAMMLVEPAYRGRGVGGALLEAAMGAIRAELPIRLDATPLGRPLYQRHGFEDEATLTRYALSAPPGPRHERGNPDQAARAQRLTASDLKIVIEQDKETGRTRGQLLEWTFDRAPDYCHVVHVPDRIAQYLSWPAGPAVRPDRTGGRQRRRGRRRARECRALCCRRRAGHRRCIRRAPRVRGIPSSAGLRASTTALQNVPACAPAIGRKRTPARALEFAILGPEFS